MPLPERRPGESREAFRARCMGDALMVREYPEAGQRLAVCEAQFGRTRGMEKQLSICAAVTGWQDVQARAVEGDGQAAKKLRRFNMVAYTGGAMELVGWPHPVVVDLAGMRVAARSRPILKDHDVGQIVGHTDNISVTESELMVAGVISGTGVAASEIVSSSENGFPWQASIGAKAAKVVFIPEGRQAVANGRNFSGPVYVVRKSVLGEVSFVALGADEDASASVAAARRASVSDTEVHDMDFEQWLLSQGFKLADLSEAQTASLKAMFEKGQAAAATAVAEPEPGKDGDGQAPAAGAQAGAEPLPDAAEALAGLRSQYVADIQRIEAVQKICGEEHRALAAKAIAEGWDTVKTELEVLRASRPKGPVVVNGRAPASQKTLEAAACLSAGLKADTLVKQYGERVMDAAYAYRHIGLRELVAECARLEGHDVPRVFGDGTETIRAGFSTISLPGILESVMNRVLLAAYEAAPIAALDICKIGSVSDFKEVSRYRLLGTGGFERVAADGELKHGKLSEDRFTNRAETYGQMLMFTRQDIINDDLGAFMEIPNQMGRSGAEVIDELFFTLLLANPGGFFSLARGNLLEGADTAFGPDSLTRAKTLFRKQKAGPGSKPRDQKPINVRPETLLVPVEVETDAELLMGAAQIMVAGGGSVTKVPTDNPHRNKYTVLSAPHLSDSYYAGASAKAWYLFANPDVLPAFELVFLNGKQTPNIERIEAPANALGMGFRAYIDVGVKEQDPRGAVKVKGEA